jgi:hypothetical protein
MNSHDFKPFLAMLDGVCLMLSRGAYTPNATSSAIFFRALVEHSIETVTAAFDAHCKDPQRGKFPPVPADILAQIEGAAVQDGRPGPEEAWSMCQAAADEARTVVWTTEMAQAWGIAWPLLHQHGDEVGARMAFKEVYLRLLAEARAKRAPVTWSPTLGTDPTMRAEALRVAVDAGRLPLTALPAPTNPVGLIEMVQTARGVPQAIRDKVAALRMAESPLQARQRASRERDAGLKAAHAERMAAAGWGDL